MKRIVSLLLTAALAVSLLCTTAFGVPVAASNKIGDVDGDGAVAIIDATAIQRHLADLVQLSADQIARGKVCGNPGLSILDATAIQRYLAGLITAFPAGEYLPTEAPTDDEPLIETVKPTEPATQPPTQAPTQPEEVTKVKNNITIYFSNNKNWTTVNAYIYKQSTGAVQAQWPGQKMTLKGTNDIGEQIYTATVDTSKYDRVIFNNGTDQTTDTPVTKASSGYFLNSKKSADYHSKFLAGLYPYGQNGEGKVSSVSMDYPDGYKKTVYIWTPEGYNAADKSKKYSVLYMCDGQNLFGQKTTLSGFEWECDESVLSLMQNGGDGIIVVGVPAPMPTAAIPTAGARCTPISLSTPSFPTLRRITTSIPSAVSQDHPPAASRRSISAWSTWTNSAISARSRPRSSSTKRRHGINT